MKISPLTILSGLLTLSFFSYQYLVGQGFCIGSDELWCKYYMSDVMRVGYFFLVLTISSLSVDLLFPESKKSWSYYLFLAFPLGLLTILYINSDALHTPTAGSFGEGDIYNMLFDKIYASIVYTVFVVGSAIVIFLEWRKSKKVDAKWK